MNKTICGTSIIGPQCRERFLPLLQPGPLTRLGVTLAGISDLKGQYRMSRLRTNFLLVLGTLDGQARLITDRQERLLQPQDLLIAHAGTCYQYELIRGRPWQIVWFHLSIIIPDQEVTIIPNSLLPKLVHEMDDLIIESAAQSWLNIEARTAKESYLTILLQRLIHSMDTNRHPPYQRSLQDLWHTVMKNLSKSWDLNQLADLAGYSAGHLNRICRATYGYPAMHHLTRLRMEHAAQLLTQRALKLQAVSAMCGYGNPFAFSVAFKRYFGVSPSRYIVKGPAGEPNRFPPDTPLRK